MHETLMFISFVYIIDRASIKLVTHTSVYYCPKVITAVSQISFSLMCWKMIKRPDVSIIFVQCLL